MVVPLLCASVGGAALYYGLLCQYLRTLAPAERSR